MVSIVITWRDRKELGVTLPHMISVAEEIKGEIILVNFGGDSELLQGAIIASPYLRLIDVGTTGYFNKPAAQNIGASYAGFPRLFFCDCDIILSGSILADLCQGLERTDRAFVTIAGVRESVSNARNANNLTCFGYRLHLKVRNGREVFIDDHEEDALTGERNAPGLLMVNKADFEFVGGYNSQLDGWGWEDQDMICRLTLHAGLARVLAGHVIHVSHPEEERMAAYPYQDRWTSRDKMFRLALANYDASRFEGSFAYDSRAYHVIDKGNALGVKLE